MKLLSFINSSKIICVRNLFSVPFFRNDRSDRLRCKQTGLSQAQVAFGSRRLFPVRLSRWPSSLITTTLSYLLANPGTVGLAITSLKWELPDGFKACPIQWQVPEKVKMVAYDAHGYNRDATLLVEMTAPDALPEEGVELKAKAVWMVCGRNPSYVATWGSKPLAQAEDCKSPDWDADGRKRIARLGVFCRK